MDELKEDKHIKKIMILYNIKYIPTYGRLIINGPIKINHFMDLKKFIFMNRLEIKDILVK